MARGEDLIGQDWSVPITVSGGIQAGTTRGASWAGIEWPRSMDARQIAADWELALAMDAEYRDRQWIARNLGDVPHVTTCPFRGRRAVIREGVSPTGWRNNTWSRES